jgi:hypothetical protein
MGGIAGNAGMGAAIGAAARRRGVCSAEVRVHPGAQRNPDLVHPAAEGIPSSTLLEGQSQALQVGTVAHQPSRASERSPTP